MSTKKIVVVFGATGNQGGSVIDEILKDSKTASEYQIRAVTRDTSKPAAVELTKRGAEVVSADMNDEASLKNAIAGAYAVWAVTNYWEKADKELEIKQGKTIANICKDTGVQLLVWSSLLNVTKLSGGKLSKVDHWDSKAEIEEYIRDIEVPAAFLLCGFYMSNIPESFQKGEDGSYTYALPIPADSPIPLFAPERDTGKFVKAILTHKEELLGKRVLGALKYYTPTEIVDEFKAIYDENATYVQLPEDTFKGFILGSGKPEYIAEELLQNMILMPQFGYYGGASLEQSEKYLDAPLTTWKEYAETTPAWKDLKKKSHLSNIVHKVVE